MINVSPSSADCDIVISGAGLIGSAFALALSQSGLRVTLVDSGPQPKTFPAMPQRVSAINLASQTMLARLGVWSEVPDDKKIPFEAIETWDAASTGSIRFESAELGINALGHIVCNNALRFALHQVIESSTPHILVFDEAIDAIKPSSNGVALTLASGRQLGTRLVIGADGPRSNVRRLGQINMNDVEYSHTAIVATVMPSQDHGQVARQRFLPDGPLAFLPLSDGRCSIVWSVPHDRALELLEADDAAFALALASAFNHRLGHIETLGPRTSFPLHRRHAETYIADRLALIGDSAHTVHPLAGLGANQGFADAAALAEVVLDAVSQNRDFACRSVLRRYERWRRGENTLVAQVIEGFYTLFAPPNGPAARLRGIGMDLTDRSTLMKSFIMRHAIGLSGDLPALVKP